MLDNTTPTLEVITESAKETQKVAQAFTKLLLASQSETALVVALTGNLGAGKTTFIQGLAQALDIKDVILSPTFLIIKRFDLFHPNFQNFYHLDAYRIKDPDEILELGWDDIIKDKHNLIIVEWADKIKDILPKKFFKVDFLIKKSKRILTISVPEK